MRWFRFAAVVVILLVALGGVGIADVSVPYRQYVEWNDIVPDEGAAFPDGTLQHFLVEMHRSDVPDGWWTLAATEPDAPDGIAQRVEYDIPRDGVQYQFRVTSYVHWPTGEIEELEPCYSEWAKALTAHPGGCQWVSR